MVNCRVLVLDGTEHDFQVSKAAKVQELFDAVCLKLELIEKDYFGLTYGDNKTGKIWLNNSKKLSKYPTSGSQVISFEVKLYPPEPFTLQDEGTRYQLFLQLRRDILSEKLPSSFMTLALLGSFAAQSELGDYDPSRNGKGYQYLTDFSFAPKQTPELLEKISELHVTHRGQTTAEAENDYLDNAKKLSLYGVHMHEAKDLSGQDVQIGVCAIGLLIFQHRLRIHRFVWAKIIKISYKRNIFTIRIRPAEHEKTESTFEYKTATFKAAKRLWKLAVEHHTFFRMKGAGPENRNTFPRFGSNYRYSGRTQTSVSSKMSGGSPGNLRQGGPFSKSTEGLAGYSTERAEKYQEQDGHHTATLNLKGYRQGSLPLLDQEDLDQYYDGSYDPRLTNQPYDGQGTIKSNGYGQGTLTSNGYGQNRYPTAGPNGQGTLLSNGYGYNNNRFQGSTPNDSGSIMLNGSFDPYSSAYNRSSHSGQINGDDGDDDLPPYQDDRLMQQKYGTNQENGKWNAMSDASRVKTSTKTYIGPDGSLITEHRTEREGVIETKMRKVHREPMTPDIDYDKALSEAILAVTNINTNLAVEKIEIQTKEEQQRTNYYDSDEDMDDFYPDAPSETMI